MCASGTQNNLENEQNDFFNNLKTQDETEFGQQQGILQQLQSTYSPILAAGPNQEGYSPTELNSYKTSATEGVATNYANASKALKESQAGQGGGNTYLPSGANEVAQGGLAEAGAQQQSDEQLQIQQADYNQGRQNFNNATSAMEGTAGLLNPNGAGSVAVNEGSSADSEANAIASENTGWETALIGAAGSVGAGALGGYLGKK